MTDINGDGLITNGNEDEAIKQGGEEDAELSE